MKKKHLKKISKYIYSEIETVKRKSIRKSSKTSHNSDLDEVEYEGGNDKWGEYNLDISNKFKKMVFNLLKYPESLVMSANIDKKLITIRLSSIKNLKISTQTQISQGSKMSRLKTASVNDDDSLDIKINEIGFSINYGYRNYSRYKDTNLFQELILDSIKVITEKNENNFKQIYESITKESGIIRDSNLDDILDD